MNLIRISEIFECPDEMFSIVGCGAIGSHTAVQLAKLGAKTFSLYDFDKVESHNIVNQNYKNKHIGKLKVEALKEILLEINPELTVITHSEDVEKKEENLVGYIFLGTDTISSRKQILKSNKANPNVLGWFDCRTELFATQLYSCKQGVESVNSLLETMNFTDEEAEASIPRSESGCRSKLASGITSALGGLATAKLFMDFVKEEKTTLLTRIDLEEFNILQI